ncbi:hypothetical protein ACQZ6H_13415 [Agrobacterium fabrum]|uniref:hypothetical protein n=1 Tax=Agrobacterium tumefaciens complex TaxID=1183400 RepID=UPI001573E08F|nr:hypothetical protein [Agrobacterium fabrum]WIE28538.1 hypothetical protein G6L42_005700 [Agrobacterium fabrum]WIE44496.1 hypothetical protein G6L76_005700 [Agrobacterium fabrum]
MKVKTISIEPVSRGYDRKTGARRLAKIQVFLPEAQITLRDIILTHDHDVGFVATPEKPKKGVPAFQWVDGSPFANAVSEAAAMAYSGMLAEDIEELKELYIAAH